jgi:branched-chain amino acid transport system permease protein
VNIINLLTQGVLLGGYYALVACGLSLMFGVMRIINLAHGDFAVAGAFLAWSVSDAADISPFLALVVVLHGRVRLAGAAGHAGTQPARRHAGAALGPGTTCWR